MKRIRILTTHYGFPNGVGEGVRWTEFPAGIEVDVPDDYANNVIGKIDEMGNQLAEDATPPGP